MDIGLVATSARNLMLSRDISGTFLGGSGLESYDDVPVVRIIFDSLGDGGWELFLFISLFLSGSGIGGTAFVFPLMELFCPESLK